ncbi:transposon-derived protein F54H12.3-like Protein [Gigaspora margarita]|uniref:Transposon-derived protein F54H12.3-like Protein n=1 Tax=Gigaspora margarita TaxID=4874 RepID=A0A8H4A9Z3_GIGMA|nr:transposon-derived protein F54H12.3-like Protein [Gigaspora margarita]
MNIRMAALNRSTFRSLLSLFILSCMALQQIRQDLYERSYLSHTALQQMCQGNIHWNFVLEVGHAVMLLNCLFNFLDFYDRSELYDPLAIRQGFFLLRDNVFEYFYVSSLQNISVSLVHNYWSKPYVSLSPVKIIITVFLTIVYRFLSAMIILEEVFNVRLSKSSSTVANRCQFTYQWISSLLVLVKGVTIIIITSIFKVASIVKVVSNLFVSPVLCFVLLFFQSRSFLSNKKIKAKNAIRANPDSLPKMPDTPDDFNDIITYLQHKTFAEKYDNPAKKSNFQRRCKNFVYNQQRGYLFFEQSSKMHEVEKYVNECPTCIQNRSIKEKSDLAPVVSDGPLEHLQVDLVNLLSYAEHNDGYSYVLTLIDVFSRYVWAIPLKDKERSTIHSELMRAVYNIPEDITLENVAPEDITPDDIALENIAPEDIIAPENITEEITLAATQDNYNQALYEFHAMQVKRVHEKVAQNNKTYQNKLVICGSVHRRKVVFEPGDKVAIAPNFDNNQKLRKRKLDQTCSITGKVISMCSNNRTVRVEVDGEVKNFTAKNLKKLRE